MNEDLFGHLGWDLGAAFCLLYVFLRPEAQTALAHRWPGWSCYGRAGPAVASRSLQDERHILENLLDGMSQRVTAFRGHPAIKWLPCHAPWGGCQGCGWAVPTVTGFLDVPQKGAAEGQVLLRIQFSESPLGEPYFKAPEILSHLNFSVTRTHDTGGRQHGRRGQCSVAPLKTRRPVGVWGHRCLNTPEELPAKGGASGRGCRRRSHQPRSPEPSGLTEAQFTSHQMTHPKVDSSLALGTFTTCAPATSGLFQSIRLTPKGGPIPISSYSPTQSFI